MNMAQLITTILEQNLSPQRMELVNESAKHKGHAGDDGSGQTHFNLMVVYSGFAGLSRIERQRMMNSLLAEAFSQGLHAISMKLLSPEEEGQ